MMKHKENSRFLLSTLLASMVALPLISACSQTASFMPESQTVAPDGTVTTSEPEPGYTQIPDMPFPGGSQMNLDRTFIVGSGESWYGQVVIETSSGANTAFDFYKQKLAEYGWQELSSVRALTSVLTYMRSNRILAIQIIQQRLGQSEIVITVSPREGMSLNN
jgi:hypothetical protein